MSFPHHPSLPAVIIYSTLCITLTLPCRPLSADATSEIKRSKVNPESLAMLEDANGKSKRTTQPTRAETKQKQSPEEQASSTSPGLKLAQSQMHELLPLLEHLKKRAPQQYDKAIRDLDRSAKRLEGIKKRDQKLFEIAMREWTMRSETQLLKAKVRVTNSSVDGEQLKQRQRALVAVQIERIEREIALCEAKQKSYEERLKSLRRQLERSNESKPQRPNRSAE